MPSRRSLPPRFAAGASGGCLLVLLAAGCGGEAVGTVAGKVTFMGRPVPEGIVSFVSDNGTVVTNQFHEGTYVVERVPVGPARITVRQLVDPSAKNPKSGGGKEIPVRYCSADDSGLRYEVVRGTQAHDLELSE